MTNLQFRDIELGQTFLTDTYEMTAERIERFAIEFDPQPMHLDPEAASEGPFGRIIASGWHTLSVTMRLMALAKPFGDTPIVGVGVTDIQFLKPVFAGAVIGVHAEVKSKRKSSKPGRGFVTMLLTVIEKDSGEPVLKETWTVLIPDSNAV